MLYLHVSNRTENLLRHLVEVLRASGRRSVFAKELLLIQSQGMERMISQTLAENFRSWCNFEYFLPLGFLQYSARLLGMEITPDGYERKIMTWRIEELLRQAEGDEYRPVRSYLQGENLELKRYQLATQLANVFDQYQLMRPEMLSGWATNRLTTGEAAERWQKSLWRALTAAQEESAPHRGAVLRQVIDRLRSGDDLAGILPQRVSVFGLSIMPPLFLQYLQGLALHSDVHLYVLSPCREYWGDIGYRRRLLQPGAAAVSYASQGLDIAPEHHPLLVSLGRQGRDFQRMLFSDEVRFELEFASYEDPLAGGESTLLRRLQSDLLAGEVTPRSEPWPERDRSIRIVSCHSRLREITVLKDHILRWLYEDPGLQLRDIVVMAPDIQEYAALIPAVFDTIQHSISDRSLRRRNSVLAAFADFLALFSGRFGWDEMLDLLKEPAIAEKLELTPSDLENLQRWVTGAGIRWGLSGQQRREMGLPAYAEGSWRAGLERLLMGYAIDSEEFVDNILPYTDIEGGGAAALGGLCQFVELVEEARSAFAIRRSLTDWSTLLLRYAGALFAGESGSGSSKDFLELHEILAGLGEGPGAFHHSPVDFRVISGWLEHTARETRSSSGFLRGQLTFCSMLPMRSIPFRVVCLIGLNDGDFPKNEQRATFDLLGVSPRPGDRSRRMDDRYQFLEAILAAREQLYLSYIGQSIKNNEPIPPSVVVTELLEVLEDSYRAENLVVAHPLQPFSSRYFSGDNANLFSYDDKYCQVAKILRQPRQEKTGWWSGVRVAKITEIPLSDLFGFYRNPQRWFVRNCLGVRLDSEMETVADSEIFAQEGLENYLVHQELLASILAEEDLGGVVKKLRAAGRWPLGTPGEISYEKKVGELKEFGKLLAGAGMGVRGEDLAIELEVGGCRLIGGLANIHVNGILLYRYGNMGGRELLNSWLHYLLYERATGAPVNVLFVGKDRSCRFRAGSGNTPDLETLVELYIQGCRQPSQLYIEPGIAWVKRGEKGEGMLDAACDSLKKILESGYDRETALLLRDCEPETVLGEEFEELCRDVLQPIWKRANGK